MNTKYVGKCLLLDDNEEKVLVVGDLHLGFERILRENGVMVPVNILKSLVEDFDLIFKHVGNINKIVLLGDIKHDFGRNEIDEYKEIGEILNYLRRKCEDVWIVKGNHDVMIEGVVRGLDRIEIKEYFLWKNVCFVHGDKDFPEIHEKAVKMWIVGHGHPAININDGTKIEKFKCFLSGTFKNKNIILVPSFFSVSDGTDPREFDLGYVWDFNILKFRVLVVEGDNSLDVLDFGELRNIKN